MAAWSRYIGNGIALCALALFLSAGIVHAGAEARLHSHAAALSSDAVELAEEFGDVELAASFLTDLMVLCMPSGTGDADGFGQEMLASCTICTLAAASLMAADPAQLASGVFTWQRVLFDRQQDQRVSVALPRDVFARPPPLVI